MINGQKHEKSRKRRKRRKKLNRNIIRNIINKIKSKNKFIFKNDIIDEQYTKEMESDNALHELNCIIES